MRVAPLIPGSRAPGPALRTPTARGGLAGLTYSATGMWQFNNQGDLFGPSPRGTTHGNDLWKDSYHLPGSRQVGLGKRLLERYAWSRFESHPEWVQPHADDANSMNPYAAGIPGEVRVFHLPNPLTPAPWGEPVTLLGLEQMLEFPLGGWVRGRMERAFARRLKFLQSCTHCGKCEAACAYGLPIMQLLDNMVQEHLAVLEAVRERGWTQRYADSPSPY